jgi:hypothetical protein
MDGGCFPIMEFKYEVEQPGLNVEPRRLVHGSGVMYLLPSFLDPRPVTHDHQSDVLRREIDWPVVASTTARMPLSYPRAPSRSAVIGFCCKHT